MSASRLQKALPQCATEEPPEHDKIGNDQHKGDKGGRTVEGKTSGRPPSRYRRDQKSGGEKRRPEVEKKARMMRQVAGCFGCRVSSVKLTSCHTFLRPRFDQNGISSSMSLENPPEGWLPPREEPPREEDCWS